MAAGDRAGSPGIFATTRPRMRECYLLEETRVIWETENWLRYTNSSS